MRTHKLQLDFQPRRDSERWAGIALLAFALAFIADLGWSWSELRTQLAHKEQRMSVLHAALAGAPVRSTPPRKISPEELGAARDTIQRIALPWDRLFRALESVQATEVALISIQPDAAAGRAIISGEARDYAAVLAYVEQLQQTQVLRDVHLVKHEQQTANPDGTGGRRAVAFALSAAWAAA